LLLPLFIEDEIKECLETHAAPIKEAIDNQQKNIESSKEKICKQYSWLDRLDKHVKRNENTIQEHDAELESLYKKLSLSPDWRVKSNMHDEQVSDSITS